MSDTNIPNPPVSSGSSNGWDLWKEHVLFRLNQNDDQHKEIMALLRSTNINVIELKTESKLGKWLGTTLIAGVVSLAVAILSHIFFKI
jgi:hypothetical protein